MIWPRSAIFLYSVPDTTRRRVVEMHSTADELPILEESLVIVVHSVMDGCSKRWVGAGHRNLRHLANSRKPRHGPLARRPPGEVVATRDLAFYDVVGRWLALTGVV